MNSHLCFLKTIKFLDSYLPDQAKSLSLSHIKEFLGVKWV
ncbi:hypothetical protein OIU84_015909 [Salix udensis]|uniref:Uncharacterized protein n=1 Tax=Salix udensis TaxID=889485 RepID=A0AAD6J817_9ROSI|nr:hypothetical protein OIU84_015909 [Salix udensis]